MSAKLTENPVTTVSIDLQGVWPSAGLYARKLWEYLFRNTEIGQADHLDSFLCDLKYFEQLFEAGRPFWWYCHGGYTWVSSVNDIGSGSYKIYLDREAKQIKIERQ